MVSIVSNNFLNLTSINKPITSELIAAIKSKNIDKVGSILKNKEIGFVNQEDENGDLPIFIAIRTGDVKIVGLLLERSDIDLDVDAGNQGKLLDAAVNSGNTEMVCFLLNHPKIDPQTYESSIYTALDLPNIEIFKMLLDRLGPNFQDPFGQLPPILHKTIRKGDLKKSELILNHPDVDVNLKHDGLRPIDIAASRGNEMVELLLKNEKTDVKGTEGTIEPIFMAIHYGDHEVFKTILDDDRQVEIYRLLKMAVQFENKQIVEVLLKSKKININERDENGQTALHLAAKLKNPTIIELLLTHDDIDVNIKDKNQNTPLYYATECCHPLHIFLLLKHKKIDVNAENERGLTSLHCAIYLKNIQILEQFLNDDRIDVNRADSQGNTPLHWIGKTKLKVKRQGEEREMPFIGKFVGKICRRLFEKNVNISQKNHKGRTFLHIVAKIYDLEKFLPIIFYKEMSLSMDKPSLMNLLGDNDEKIQKMINKQAQYHLVSKKRKYTQKLGEALTGINLPKNVTILSLLNDQDVEGNTPLHLAILNGNSSAVEDLLKYSEVDINIQNNKGEIPSMTVEQELKALLTSYEANLRREALINMRDLLKEASNKKPKYV